MNEKEIGDILARENEEYKKLGEEHRGLDEEIKKYDGKVYLTPAEEMERKRIQKLKLQKKDRMAQLVRAYRTKHSS